MKKIQLCILVFTFLWSAAFAQRKYVGWSTGYHTTWGPQSVANTNFKCYTHIAYFNGSINPPSTSEGQTFTTACHNNNTKALLCIGGGGAGGSFMTSTSNNNLANFITTIVNAMTAQKFDGVDIDWEDNVNSAQYTAFVQQLSAALGKISPKPLLTIATGMGLAQYTVPVAAYADQLNLMSYYDYLTGGGAPVPTQLAAFTSKGVAKSKLGLGYGYDTDNEVDGPNEAGNGPNGNPSDIDAKINYTINNGYGGIMVWEIARAPKVCDSVTAYYVNKNITPVLAALTTQQAPQSIFSIINNGTAGAGEIRYCVSSAQCVNIELFNMNGSCLQKLASGTQDAGTHIIALGKGNSGFSIAPGAYVVKMATPERNQAQTIFVK